jgi:dTDP-4-dehydrorhamnose reductase
MKILVLGHNGLLGNAVLTYLFFKYKDDVMTTSLRWGTDEFKHFIQDTEPEYIINCIGAIPQRKYADDEYDTINYDLPLWLDNLGIKIIHPDTDEPEDTPYGISKAKARRDCNKNTKIIKTSIIGFERGSNFSFLEWFLSQEDGSDVNGYLNQLWNGNTTLEWSQWADKMIIDWDNFKHTTTLANPDCHSKFQLLLLFKTIFEKDITVNPFECEVTKNNCLMPDYYTKEISTQIYELKNFFKR